MYRRKFVSIEANLIALKERIIVPILHVLLLIEDLYLIQSAVVRPPHYMYHTPIQSVVPPSTPFLLRISPIN